MPRLLLKIDFNGHRLGRGKIELLEHIAETGSISQAARKMTMSYRRAWLLIDELNHMFAEPCVESTTGGAGGGGARLTDFARLLVRTFRTAEQRLCESVAEEFKFLKKPDPDVSGG